MSTEKPMPIEVQIEHECDLYKAAYLEALKKGTYPVGVQASADVADMAGQQAVKHFRKFLKIEGYID